MAVPHSTANSATDDLNPAILDPDDPGQLPAEEIEASRHSTRLVTDWLSVCDIFMAEHVMYSYEMVLAMPYYRFHNAMLNRRGGVREQASAVEEAERLIHEAQAYRAAHPEWDAMIQRGDMEDDGW